MAKANSSKPPAKLEKNLSTITLKVYIHCEGCRRKVRRIIRVLDGVETVTVDSTTGKVTVTGTVDSTAILQRLQKHGKHAEMWPSSNPGGNSAASAKACGDNQQGKLKASTDGETNKKKSNAPAADGGGGDKPAAGVASEGKKGGAQEVKLGEVGALNSSSPETKKEATGAINKGGGTPSPNGSSGGGGGGGGDNGGGGGKKVGKKAGNGGGNNSNGGGATVEAAPITASVKSEPAAVRNPNVVMSANKSCAPSSYDTVQMEYAAYNSAEFATHMFSDENANNCSIM